MISVLVAAVPVFTLCQVSPAWQPFVEVKPDAARVAFVKAMSKDLNSYSRKLIVGALSDPSGVVVAAAIETLKKDHSSATFHALVAGLPQGSQWEGGNLLGSYNEPTFVRAMSKLLRHERKEVRRPIALALGLSQSRLALAPLHAATHDPDRDVRFEVGVALARFGKSDR